MFLKNFNFDGQDLKDDVWTLFLLDFLFPEGSL